MREEQMDAVFEAYHDPVFQLVTGRAGLRERLRAALAELRKCQPACVAWPASGCEEKVAEDLPQLLEAGERLDALTDAELEDLAVGIRRTQRKVEAALVARAAEQQDELLD